MDPYDIKNNKLKLYLIIGAVIVGSLVGVILLTSRTEGEVAGVSTEDFSEESAGVGFWVDYQNNIIDEIIGDGIEDKNDSEQRVVKQSEEKEEYLAEEDFDYEIHVDETLSPEEQEDATRKEVTRIRQEMAKLESVCGDHILKIGVEECESNAHCGANGVCSDECICL